MFQFRRKILFRFEHSRVVSRASAADTMRNESFLSLSVGVVASLPALITGARHMFLVARRESHQECPDLHWRQVHVVFRAIYRR